MITNKGWCNHKDGGYPEECENEDFISSIGSMESYCTNHPSCVGYSYNADTQQGYLYPNDGTCPCDFYLSKSDLIAKTMDDLAEQVQPGYVCYGKIGNSVFVV